MENSKQLNEWDWRRLLATLQRDQCVLLLGSGVAIDPANPGSGPLTTCLARRLAKQLPSTESPGNPDDLAHVAQLYWQHRKDRLDLELAVQDFFKPYVDAEQVTGRNGDQTYAASAQTTPLHKALAVLPFTLCINTSFDHFFCNALEAANKLPVHEYYHFRKGRPHPKLTLDHTHPLVYSLYGDCQEGDSLVLTENDLLEFLVNVIRGSPKLPPYITARFRDPKTSFLFLGFGFRHWYVRILLHVLQAYGHGSHSLALEDADFFDHPDQPQTTVFYTKSYLIEFRHLSWEDFAAELQQRYARAESARAESEARKSEPLVNAPEVFLCYCREDQDSVETIADQLRERGIRTWLDKQNLRGGDNWERQIQHIIKQVDYFVVFLSSALLAQKESYCYKEINAALERQKSFKESCRFLIPALLDPVAEPDIPSTLTSIHSVDLKVSQGIQDLAKAILEDWDLPGRRRSAA